jgi:hypothetical protein
MSHFRYNVLGGSAPATSFADTFNRASSSGLGVNWLNILARTNAPYNSPASTGTASIGVLADAGQGCLLSFAGVANPNYFWAVAWVPAAMWVNIYNTRKQFAQFTFIQLTANVLAGLSCYFSSVPDGSGTGFNTLQQYVVQFPNGSTPNLVRRNWGVADSTLIASGAGLPAPVINDVWRLSVDSSSGSATVVTVTVNGVVKGTVSDNNVNRLSSGAPCIYLASMNQTGGFQCRNFSCGIGL